MAILRAGIVQTRAPAPPYGDLLAIRTEALQRSLAWLDQAAAMGVRLLAFPELFLYPWFPAELDPRWEALAEPLEGGPTLRFFQAAAKRYGVVLVVPFLERTPEGRRASTAAVVDADGSLVGAYRKHHVPDRAPAHRERFHLDPGDGGYPVFQTRAGRFGVCLGYDRHFPEVTRAMGIGGAEILLVLAAAHAGAAERLWDIEPLALGVQNGCFLLAANRVGVELPGPDLSFFGASYLAGPGGRVLARASREREEVVRADLDLGRLRENRHRWNPLPDRRPDTYTALTRLLEIETEP